MSTGNENFMKHNIVFHASVQWISCWLHNDIGLVCILSSVINKRIYCIDFLVEMIKYMYI